MLIKSKSLLIHNLHRIKKIPTSSSEYQSWALLCNLYRDVWPLPGDLGLTVIDDLLQKGRPEIAEMLRAE